MLHDFSATLPARGWYHECVVQIRMSPVILRRWCGNTNDLGHTIPKNPSRAHRTGFLMGNERRGRPWSPLPCGLVDAAAVTPPNPRQ